MEIGSHHSLWGFGSPFLQIPPNSKDLVCFVWRMLLAKTLPRSGILDRASEHLSGKSLFKTIARCVLAHGCLYLLCQGKPQDHFSVQRYCICGESQAEFIQGFQAFSVGWRNSCNLGLGWWYMKVTYLLCASFRLSFQLLVCNPSMVVLPWDAGLVIWWPLWGVWLFLINIFLTPPPTRQKLQKPIYQ